MMNTTAGLEGDLGLGDLWDSKNSGQFFSKNSESSRGMVIAIQTPHSRHILEGSKEIEFRRTKLSKENTPKIGIIYEPSPTQSIIGAFRIQKIEHRSVAELWDLARRFTPSTKDSFFQYFEGKDTGTAIFLDDVIELEPPINLHSSSGSEWAFTPPQNYYYVDVVRFFNKLSNI